MVKISDLTPATTPLNTAQKLVTELGGVNFSVDLATLAGALSAGVSINGQTLTYTGDLLTSVSLYEDAAKTNLYRTLTLNRTGDVLTSIEVDDDTATLVETITLTYSSGKLIGITRT